MPRRLRKSLFKETAEEGAPPSCPGQKYSRRFEPKTKRTAQDSKHKWARQKRFLIGNLGKLRPRFSLLHDGQSTDDSLIRKDKGEEMKPRSRPSSTNRNANKYHKFQPSTDYAQDPRLPQHKTNQYW